MANNWAIVVGINEYEFLPNVSLKFAVADALAMQKFLCEEAGFDAEKVLLYGDGLNGTKRATKPNLRHILLNELQCAYNADNLWFFFSGHGLAGGDQQDYLMTIDANPSDLQATSISTHFVADRLRACKAKNIVLVLDMCRNENRDAERKSVELQRKKQQGIITMHSCDRNQSSYEISDLRQGAFTYALLQGLRETVSVRDLALYLESRVPELHQWVGKSQRVQVPQVIPDPGWKYDQPILTALVPEIAEMEKQAIKAESDAQGIQVQGSETTIVGQTVNVYQSSITSDLKISSSKVHEKKSFQFLIKVGEQANRYWREVQQPMKVYAIQPLPDECIQFFEVDIRNFTDDVDPSFNITLISNLNSINVVHEFGIKIVSVANDWKTYGITQATEIIQQAKYEIDIPDIRSEIALELDFFRFPRLLEPRKINRLLTSDRSKKFILDAEQRILNYEVLLRNYMQNMPNYASIQFWIKTQDTQHFSHLIHVFSI